MLSCRSITCKSEGGQLEVNNIFRNNPGDNEVLILIYFVGLGRYDIQKINNDWKDSIYPLTPGLEIIGIVKEVGKNVEFFKELDMVVVNNYVNSCKKCEKCNTGNYNNCENGAISMYGCCNKYNENLPEFLKNTDGGFSQIITVDQDFVYKIIDNNLGINLTEIVPMTSSGLAVYSPLKKFMKISDKVGIIGLGGLGHLGVKLAIELGGNVTVFSQSEWKRDPSLLDLLAHSFINTETENFEHENNSFDLLLNTIPYDHDISKYVNLLKDDGKLVMLGLPKSDKKIKESKYEIKNREIVKSFLGSNDELDELIDLSLEKNIFADVEVVNYDRINHAVSNILTNNVKFKYVLDVTSLQLINN